MKSTTTTTSITRKQSSRGFGVVFGTLFFGVFFLLGSGFTLFLVTDFQKTLDTYSWKEVPAEIHSVNIKRNQRNDEDSTPYELELQYSYKDGGNNFFKTEGGDSHRYSMYEYADDIASAHPIGSTRTAYVNPTDPSDSVLIRKSLWTGLFVLIPLIFVIIGGGGLFYTWFSSKKKTSLPLSPNNQEEIPQAPTAVSGISKFLGYAFLLGGGIGLYYFMQFAELNWRAQEWKETPAKVLESSIITHESTDSDGHTSITYSLDIFYEYTFEGQTYRASRYEFSSGSSSGYNSKKRILDKYPPGAATIAYVNPENPKQATLNNSLSWFLLIGLLPLIFLGLGLLMVFGGTTARASGNAGLSGLSSTSPAATALSGPGSGRFANASGEQILQSNSSPKTVFIGTILICLFWNGIVSIFVYQAYAEWVAGQPDIFMMLFLVPFLLVDGVLMGCKAEENPFRVSQIEQLPFLFSSMNWPLFFERLTKLHHRAAIVGPHGTGKTTLLEELKRRLESAGQRALLIRLTESEKRLPDDFQQERKRVDYLLLDGAEQLSWIQWMKLKTCLSNHQGLIITTHRPGRLPTLYECDASLATFRALIERLAPDWREKPKLITEVFQRHAPNIRNALFEMYTQASGADGANSPHAHAKSASLSPQVCSSGEWRKGATSAR